MEAPSAGPPAGVHAASSQNGLGSSRSPEAEISNETPEVLFSGTVFTEQTPEVLYCDTRSTHQTHDGCEEQEEQGDIMVDVDVGGPSFAAGGGGEDMHAPAPSTSAPSGNDTPVPAPGIVAATSSTSNGAAASQDMPQEEEALPVPATAPEEEEPEVLYCGTRSTHQTHNGCEEQEEQGDIMVDLEVGGPSFAAGGGGEDMHAPAPSTSAPSGNDTPVPAAGIVAATSGTFSGAAASQDMLQEEEALPVPAPAPKEEEASVPAPAPTRSWDRSPDGIQIILHQLNNLVFPNEEGDGTGNGEYGQATLEKAFDMIKDVVGCGYELRMEKKTRIYTSVQMAASPGRRNRYNCVRIECIHSGKPKAKELTPDMRARRKTKSRKLGCSFGFSLWWAVDSVAPVLRKGIEVRQLRHEIPGSGGTEHDRVRSFDNELTYDDIQAQASRIRELHDCQVGTVAIHKTLESVGRRLGRAGRQMVRAMRDGFDAEKQKTVKKGLNDAQRFVEQLDHDGAFMRFQMDEEGRLVSIAWAHKVQRHNAMLYHPVIVTDTTFNTNVYNLKLALIVVVDKENHTQIAMQGLLSTERHESFVFLLEAFKQLIYGRSPQVIFTDTDQAEMSAIKQVFPGALNKLCFWHTLQNVREHGKGLPKGVMHNVLGKFKGAAYAPTEEIFLQCKAETLSLLPTESAVYKYMAENIFSAERAGKWASFVHPGLHTLGIASTQRVESMNSAFNKMVTRKGDMVALDRAIMTKIQDDTLKTAKRTAGGNVQRTPLRKNMSVAESVRDGVLAFFDFVHDAMKHERCSAYAKEDTEEQTRACLLYGTTTVATGEEAVHKLLQEFEADPRKAKLMYDTNSGEFIDPSDPSTDSTCVNRPNGVHMTSRTPVPHFAALLRDQTVDKLVRVNVMQKPEVGHLVALGRDGFFLCTCLRQLVYGLLCPHGLKAMLDNGVNRFSGACIAPRWRESGTPWTLEALAAKPARLASVGVDCSVELPAYDPNPACSHSVNSVKSAAYENGIAFGKDMGVALRDINSVQGIERVLESTKIFFKQQLEVEKRSQENASSTRVFTGVVLPGLSHGDAGGRRGEQNLGGSSSVTAAGEGRGGSPCPARGGGSQGHFAGLAPTVPTPPVPAGSAGQPSAAADSTAAPVSAQATLMDVGNTLQGSAAPQGDVNIGPGGYGQPALAPPPVNVLNLDRLQPPPRVKQTGSRKRLKSGGLPSGR